MSISFALMVGMCCVAPGTVQDIAQGTTEPYQFKPRSGEPVDAELGAFRVLENRNRQESRIKIELKYIRFPATCKSPGPPIVYLAGGPGGSATAAARGDRFEMFQRLRQLGDVIAFDQRGTGMSHLLPASSHRWRIPRDQAATRAVVSNAVRRALEKSISEWREAGINLNAYTTLESVHDIEALRHVLGVEKIRLCGISYGTHLSLAYMRAYPDSIQSVVLAGVEGPDHTVKCPVDQQRLLEQIDSWIKEQPAARNAYPDFLGSVERVLTRLKQAPATIKQRNGKTRFVITHFDIQRLAAAFLRGPENFRVLPSLFKQMDEGDFSKMPFYLYGLRQGGFSPMGLAMDAASGRTENRAESIRQQAAGTLLGDAINFPYEIIRESINVNDLGDPFRAELQSELPVLAISGTADGRTPPGNAIEVLKTLPNGTHLVIEGAGHSDPLFLSSPEILETMLKFYAGEKVADKRIQLPPIEFVLPN